MDYHEKITKLNEQIKELFKMPTAHFSVEELAVILNPWGNVYEKVDKIYKKVKLNEIKT